MVVRSFLGERELAPNETVLVTSGPAYDIWNDIVDAKNAEISGLKNKSTTVTEKF